MSFRIGSTGVAAGILAAALGAVPAVAGPVTINFADGSLVNTCSGAGPLDCSGTDGTDGNQRVFTFLDGDGLTSRVRVTAWSADQSNGDGSLSNYQTAYTGLYGGGLGVTNRNEGDGADNATHTTDNNGKKDLLVFHFDGVVTATRAELNSYVMSVTGFATGTDTDASFFIGNIAQPWSTQVDLANATQRLSVLTNYLDTLGSSSNSAQTGVMRDFNHLATQKFKGNTLVVAASLGDYLRGTANSNRRDNFKLEALKVEYAVPIPAPAGLALFGLGALALGLRRRR